MKIGFTNIHDLISSKATNFAKENCNWVIAVSTETTFNGQYYF